MCPNFVRPPIWINENAEMPKVRPLGFHTRGQSPKDVASLRAHVAALSGSYGAKTTISQRVVWVEQNAWPKLPMRGHTFFSLGLALDIVWSRKSDSHSLNLGIECEDFMGSFWCYTGINVRISSWTVEQVQEHDSAGNVIEENQEDIRPIEMIEFLSSLERAYQLLRDHDDTILYSSGQTTELKS